MNTTATADPSDRQGTPTGPLREASWRSRRLSARLADLPDHAPVMTGDELLTDAGYDGTVRLHTARTAPPAPGSELRPAAPATVWRSTRTALLTAGELREHLIGLLDFAPVTVDGDELEDADYGGALQLYTPYTGAPDEDQDDEDDDEGDED